MRRRAPQLLEDPPEASATIADARAPQETGAAPAAGAQATTDVPAAPSNPKALARQIRAAKRLSPALKRYWLALLPHLHDDDRRRLAAIIRGDAQ